MDFLSPSIPFIQTLQSISWLLAPMKLVTLLGNEEFFLLLLPLIYWLFNRKLGAELGILLLISVCLNDLAKLLFHLPRPYWYGQVQAFSTEKSFGFPSGHAQNATLLWPFIALQSNNRKLWLPLAIVLIALISLSRLYLGVHFPLDIVGGWIIGISLLWLAVAFAPSLSARWREMGWIRRLTFTFLMVGFIALAFAIVGTGGTYEAAAGPDALARWNAGESIIARIAALAGLFVGLCFAPKFETSGSSLQKIARLLVGLIGLAVFYIGLKKVLPDESLSRFVRYFLTTFWVMFAAPMLFLKLGLSELETQKRPVD